MNDEKLDDAINKKLAGDLLKDWIDVFHTPKLETVSRSHDPLWKDKMELNIHNVSLELRDRPILSNQSRYGCGRLCRCPFRRVGYSHKFRDFQNLLAKFNYRLKRAATTEFDEATG